MSLEVQKYHFNFRRVLLTGFWDSERILNLPKSFRVACVQPPVPSIVPLRDSVQGEGAALHKQSQSWDPFLQCHRSKIERSGWDQDNWQA